MKIQIFTNERIDDFYRIGGGGEEEDLIFNSTILRVTILLNRNRNFLLLEIPLCLLHLRLICLGCLNNRFPARWNRERIREIFISRLDDELIFRASLLLIGFRPILMEHGRNLINPFGLPVNQVSYASCVTRNWNFSLRNCNLNVEISRSILQALKFFVILFS